MSQERIELDYAGFGHWPHLTHIPSGDTCLMKPHMNHREWLEAKQAFLNKYPDLVIIDLENGSKEANRANVMET